MIRPDSLKPGDTIGIAATARKISREEVEIAKQVFQSWGLQVKLSPTLFQELNQFAGSDEARTSGMQSLLDDPEVKAIILARGGYGTVRIIDHLDFSAVKKSPKWMIGFSDATVLHAHMHRHVQMQTLHAPMILNMQPERWDEESMLALKKVLFSDKPFFIDYKPHALNREGTASGSLVGGNLSVLYSLLGSPSDINTAGCILFLEDIDEYVYHIDRIMMNMKRNGKLESLSGLIVGNMSDMKDNAIPFGKSAEEIIAEHVSSYQYPVCFGFPAGHEKRNLPMVFGAESQLQVHKHEVRLIQS
ncbi:MAG: LD-carboxypeptidase [Bacteroidia bacterium]|jgi:muramoyltetrapeptide carboxypeptidase